MNAGVKHYATLVGGPRRMSQPGQAMSIIGADRGGSLDFDTPYFFPVCDDQIHFVLILVAVVPKAQIRIRPSRLADELLDHERFEERAESAAIGQPVRRAEIRQRCSQTGVHHMQFWRLDEPVGLIEPVNL